MASGLAIMPLVFSNGVFCTRRTQSGADALSMGNPFVGAMNIDIAGGQIFKAADAISNIAKESKNTLASGFVSAEESIKAISKGDKLLKGVGQVLNFTADNINPIICATGAVKVLTADDKEDAAIQEGLALGAMFAAEKTAKKILGMPETKKFNKKTMTETNEGLFKIKENGGKELLAENGKYKILNNNKLVITKDGLYKNNPFLSKQADAIKDFCETNKVLNKSIKFVPGMVKGLGFVGASIGGYKLGMAIAEELTGEKSA